MYATMKDLLDYAEITRKLRENPVKITVWGNEGDEFLQVTIFSGNTNPMIENKDKSIACELDADGNWMLIHDYHLEDRVAEPIDTIERSFLIEKYDMVYVG